MVFIIEFLFFFWKLIKYLFFFAVKKRFKICDKDVEVKKAENKNEGGGRNYFVCYPSYWIKFLKKSFNYVFVQKVTSYLETARLVSLFPEIVTLLCLKKKKNDIDSEMYKS